ncbi:hypothetical protein [Pedobacter agri]|uniref:hypothetical protein n=1 Tax=Pedobacter agri TaxID=454586 RepID=UPI0027802B8E|nr:hypothetical protein [Pedobacter agri]MDQ1139408.1 hypothetical protein [Pedobacter agri]
MAYKYTLGGIDLSTIGVYVESGSNDFLKLPDLKEPYKVDWAEMNGIEVDLADPKFKEKEITLNLAIHATSETQFWNNYNAFLNILRSPGTKRLFVGDLGRSFFVYYSKMNNYQKLSPIAGEFKIGAKYSVTFIEPIPSLLKPFAFLTKKGGGYLLTTSGSLLNTAT